MIIASVFSNILSIIVALIVFILVLGIIILIHEGGHFYFAKKAGILCHEYSIGMGPVIKQWKKGETAYSLRAIPIGGYVSMAGEDTNENLLKEGQTIALNFEEVNRFSLFLEKALEGETDNSKIRAVSEIILNENMEGEVKGVVKGYDLYSKDGTMMYLDIDVEGETSRFYVKRDALYVFSEKERIQLAPYDRCFESKSLPKRFMTVFAGPMMNFVLALFIFLIVGMASGVPNYESNKIGEVTTGYPAGEVLQKGDKIISVDGNKIEKWTEFSEYMESLNGQESVELVVDRDGTQHNFVINTVVTSFRLGVSNALDTKYTGEGLKISLVFQSDYVVGKAGLVDGDILLGYYDGDVYTKLESWEQLLTFIDANPDLNSLKIKYDHNGEIKETTSEVWTQGSLKPLNLPAASKTAVGISCGTHFSLIGGLKNTFVNFWHSITTVFVTLGALFSNSQIGVKDLSGPVGIFSAIKTYLSTDIITFLAFVALISANIGLLNLLPIPALDGGRIVFLGYEMITRKKVNKKFETVLNNVVLWLFMLLFIYVTFNDILRLF